MIKKDISNADFEKFDETSKRLSTLVSLSIIRAEQLQQSMKQVSKIFQKSFENTKIALDASHKAIQQIASIDWSKYTIKIENALRELPPLVRKAIIRLGNNGWYLDTEMPIFDSMELVKELAGGEIREIEIALIEYFQSRLDEIEEYIVKKFPKRVKLTIAAFSAHRRGEYELSIPVLFSQTDGICKDVSDGYFFMKDNGQPQTAKYVRQYAIDSFTGVLLTPLVCTLPINASKYQRDEKFSGLNRHMVLHGESLNYGSKLNSLKEISLLNYVAHVLKVENEIE